MFIQVNESYYNLNNFTSIIAAKDRCVAKTIDGETVNLFEFHPEKRLELMVKFHHQLEWQHLIVHEFPTTKFLRDGEIKEPPDPRRNKKTKRNFPQFIRVNDCYYNIHHIKLIVIEKGGTFAQTTDGQTIDMSEFLPDEQKDFWQDLPLRLKQRKLLLDFTPHFYPEYYMSADD